MKVTKELEQKIIEEYKIYNKTDIVAQKYGLYRGTIVKILKRNNIKYTQRGKHRLVPFEIESNVLNEYEKTKNMEFIARKFNVPSSTVMGILKRTGVYVKRSKTPMKLSEKEEKDLIKDYETNKNTLSLAAKYCVSRKTVLNILQRNNIEIQPSWISKRVYDCDFSFFNKIDTEAKAYWLGFIFADGNNSRGRLHIGIHKKDAYLLKRFKSDIKAEQPVKICKYKSKGKDSWIARIDICSFKMIKDLEKYGVIPNKTGRLDWEKVTSQIPYHLIQFLILGFFDGDGCVSKPIPGCQFGICEKGGHFLKGIKEYFRSAGLKSESKIRLCGDRNDFYVYVVGGRNNMLKLYEIIYTGATIFLERKKLRFEQYLFGHSKSFKS